MTHMDLLARSPKIHLGGQEVVSLLSYSSKQALAKGDNLREVLANKTVPLIVEVPAREGVAAHTLLLNATPGAMSEFVTIGRTWFARTMAFENEHLRSILPGHRPEYRASIKAEIDAMARHLGVQGAEILGPDRAVIYLESSRIFFD